MTRDAGTLDAARRAQAQVVIRQYLDAMAELGYSHQEAGLLLQKEETT